MTDSPNTTETAVPRGRPKGSTYGSSYAACWPLYLTCRAKAGIEALQRRYEATSRAAIMRAVLDLGLERAVHDPAVLQPLLAPRLVEK